jgi:hydroxymethylpyrimidine pyrophosphatase-like HAD family hydrolase
VTDGTATATEQDDDATAADAAAADDGGAATPPAADLLLVALDVDGTLMSYDQEMSDDVRDAVVALRAAGHHVVLASGRSLVAMTPVAALLGIDRGLLVASNGAVTARLDPDEPDGYVLEEVVTFDPGPALRLLRDRLPHARYAVEDVGVGFRMNELFPAGELDGVHRVVAFDELWAGEVTRVVVRAPGSTSEEFHALVEQLGLDDVTYAVGWTAWMDLAPLGVTKATGLERVRRALGVPPHRTVAVGDGRNDVEMLRWAARGVAMGHADDVVRAAADEVTAPIADDGVVPVLRSLLT